MSVGAVVNDGAITNQLTPEAAAEKKAKESKSASGQKEEFLSLLVAQMKYQDPLEPTSNTEYISQYATFSSLEQMQNMSQSLAMSRASDMVGKYVVIHEEQENGSYREVEGRVDFVTYESGKAKVSVNGVSYDADEVYSVVADDFESSTANVDSWLEQLSALPHLDKLTEGDAQTIRQLNEAYKVMEPGLKALIPENALEDLETYMLEVERIYPSNTTTGQDNAAGQLATEAETNGTEETTYTEAEDAVLAAEEAAKAMAAEEESEG